jgi:hypothetical protein
MKSMHRTRRDRAALDVVVLATLGSVFAIMAVPWLRDLSSPPIGAMGWQLGVLCMGYWSAAVLLDRVRNPRAAAIGTLALQVAAILTLAWWWHLSGGFQNAAFLLAFAPVLLGNAVLQPGWSSLTVTGISWMSVVAVALSESDGVRIYAYRVSPLLTGLGDLVGRSLPSSVSLEPSPSPAFCLVALLMFLGMSLLVVAVGRVLARHAEAGAALDRALREGDPDDVEIFLQIVERDPHPRVLVDPGEGRIIHMNPSFRRQMLAGPSAAALFDVVAFEDAATARRLLLEETGEIPECRYSVGPEHRLGRLRAHRVEHRLGPLVSLTFEEQELAASRPPRPAALAAGASS